MHLQVSAGAFLVTKLFLILLDAKVPEVLSLISLYKFEPTLLPFADSDIFSSSSLALFSSDSAAIDLIPDPKEELKELSKNFKADILVNIRWYGCAKYKKYYIELQESMDFLFLICWIQTNHI